MPAAQLLQRTGWGEGRAALGHGGHGMDALSTSLVPHVAAKCIALPPTCAGSVLDVAALEMTCSLAWKVLASTRQLCIASSRVISASPWRPISTTSSRGRARGWPVRLMRRCALRAGVPAVWAYWPRSVLADLTYRRPSPTAPT